MREPITFTVSELNDYVKALIDSSEVLSNVAVVGEISNFNNHYKTGHFYFTLKDENALVKAVMFRSYSSQVKFEPDNNMKVLCVGRVSVFPRDGVYQLYVEHMEPFGLGELYAAFEKLKLKLQGLGMFDESLKKPLPRFPKRVGIITSPEAAAVADMKNILTRRYPLCEIHIYPSLVQGPGAPRELCDGIVHFDNDPDCDVIIIGRGGGSLEDLWAFNDEILARTIFACRTPVISAVGHETDYTICDFVSDLRAPTPSAAAELCVPDMNELKSMLSSTGAGLLSSMKAIISDNKSRLDVLREKRCLKSPQYYVEAKSEALAHLERSIDGSVKRIFEKKASLLSQSASRLSALNPMAVLARGYGALFTDDDRVITKASSLKSGDEIQIRLSDGKVKAEVKETIQEDK